MKIVAEKHVRGRSLLGYRFQRGMRLEHAHYRKPTAVGDAEEANAAVVVRNIFHQPVDGVVRVRAFVNARSFGMAVGIAYRPLHDERALRTKTSANVLENENVVVGNHFGVAIEDAA